MFKNLIYLRFFKDNEFLFYFIIVFKIIKNLIFDHDVFIVINAFNNKIVMLYINFK